MVFYYRIMYDLVKMVVNMLDNIIIVLCNPDEPRNIGSACRAMLNMGINRLRIVGKKENYDEESVLRLAIHGKSVWDNAEFYDTLDEAVCDCFICAGTTRRKGKKRKNWAMTPEEFAEFVGKDNKGNVAVVFGNERTGLTDSELEACTCCVSIPSWDGFPSLNLSHAVQIISYVLFTHKAERKYGYEPVSIQETKETVSVMTKTLKTMGFYKISSDHDMSLFFSSVLARAALSKGENDYIKKIFNKMEGLFLKEVQKQEIK